MSAATRGSGPEVSEPARAKAMLLLHRLVLSLCRALPKDAHVARSASSLIGVVAAPYAPVAMPLVVSTVTAWLYLSGIREA